MSINPEFHHAKGTGRRHHRVRQHLVCLLSLAPLFKGIKVLACADLNRNAAELRAEEFGVTAQSIEELLANKDIDVVVNLTIPAAHFLVSKAALEAGKHVYSEKPLVLSLEEGEELRRIAREKNLSLAARLILSLAARISLPGNISTRARSGASPPAPAM